MSIPSFHEETFLSASATREVIQRMADRMLSDLSHPEERVLVGIRRGGAVVAKLLKERLDNALGTALPIGFLDITFYRDDLRTIAPNPVVGGTDLVMSIDNRRILLIDDVMFTGRTIRAALNALFDYGRPERVELAVLLDRGGRQLPIRPDHAGLVCDADPKEMIKLVEQEKNEWVVVRRHPIA